MREKCFFRDMRCIFPIACDRGEFCRKEQRYMLLSTRKRGGMTSRGDFTANEWRGVPNLHEEENVIEVLWCTIDDPETNAPGCVGHAFPDTDENRQTFTQTRTVKEKTGNSYGTPTYQDRQEVTTVIVYCGYHWERQNPFQKAPKEAATKLELEQSEQYNEGWEDARAHYEKLPPVE